MTYFLERHDDGHERVADSLLYIIPKLCKEAKAAAINKKPPALTAQVAFWLLPSEAKSAILYSGQIEKGLPSRGRGNPNTYS